MTTEQAKKVSKQYYSIKHPNRFVNYFKDIAEFRQWCTEGSKEDLQATLQAFEKAELYEYCVVINEVKLGIETKKMAKCTKKHMIVRSGNDIVIYETVSGELTNEGFRCWEKIVKPVEGLIFDVYYDTFEVMDADCTRVFLKPLFSLVDGFMKPVHDKEGVRDYLLKLGIKENE